MEQKMKVFENEKEKLISRLRKHDFLRRCRSGRVSINELKVFLIQQGIYSSHFTRYLCALMANMKHSNDIRVLAENLFEELGFLGTDQRSHGKIYQEMLSYFSLSLDEQSPTEGTQQLINRMLDHCQNGDPANGLGALCLGAEAQVPFFYSDIICGFKQHDIDDKHIEFFLLHVECDDVHSDLLFEVMNKLIKENQNHINTMIQAGNDLVDARLNFLSKVVEKAEDSVCLTS